MITKIIFWKKTLILTKCLIPNYFLIDSFKDTLFKIINLKIVIKK